MTYYMKFISVPETVVWYLKFDEDFGKFYGKRKGLQKLISPIDFTISERPYKWVSANGPQWFENDWQVMTPTEWFLEHL